MSDGPPHPAGDQENRPKLDRVLEDVDHAAHPEQVQRVNLPGGPAGFPGQTPDAPHRRSPAPNQTSFLNGFASKGLSHIFFNGRLRQRGPASLLIHSEPFGMSEDIGKGRWALILGASSGFGEACARALAEVGYNIFGVHLDRRAGLEHVKLLKADLEATGQKAHFFNINAADPEKMEDALGGNEGASG